MQKVIKTAARVALSVFMLSCFSVIVFAAAHSPTACCVAFLVSSSFGALRMALSSFIKPTKYGERKNINESAVCKSKSSRIEENEEWTSE